MIKATKASTAYWSDILVQGAKNTKPWQIFVSTDKFDNASATSHSVNSDGVHSARESLVTEEIYVKNQLQDGEGYKPLLYEDAITGYLPQGKYAFSDVAIGAYMGAERTGAIKGWWVDTDTALPANEQAADFVGAFRHELGHALGIHFASARQKILENDEFKDVVVIDSNIKDKNSWTLHLQDQNGKPAQAGMYIVSSAEATDHTKNYFVVDKQVSLDGKGYAYFVGEHVTEALSGATFFGRSGLPVNGWEKDSQAEYDFEGSHLQTAGMMSHRIYSNYTSFLEVELAAMQDMGYMFDRKAYFGRSIYGNGGDIVNTQGYFQRNAEGTAYLDNTYSLVPLGVGLHIYGSDNRLTQNANIMTAGTGAVGVRVDGTGNTLIVPENTEIHADGLRGNGLLIAYGRNHTIEQAGTVTAKGKGGTGVLFDFGSSSNGAGDEYRGSYIRYKRAVQPLPDPEEENNNTTPNPTPTPEPGTIVSAENLSLIINNMNEYNAKQDELNGPLVENYNLSGTLIGEDNAIYIGKNAFVKNININEGARIQGNITSDWKQFGATECEGSYDVKVPLRVQYNGKYKEDGYAYKDYIPDLVTNLNFNTDMYYNGNITGEDNMKMNIYAGALTYEGTANVVSVKVAENAALLGGTYTVNDMSSRMGAGMSDDTTGWFISLGTIGASAADRNMTINGHLLSNGNLQYYGGGKGGQIAVSGEAHIDGSTVTAYNMLPGEKDKPVLTANKIIGSITNEDTAVPVSGMLNVQGKISSDRKAITVETKAANNLGTTDAAVNHTYDAVMNMYDGLGDEKFQKGELRKLFSLESETAVKALQDIASPNAAQGISMTQTSTVTSHILSTRLSEAFAMKNVDISVPVAKLADDKESTVNEGLKLQAKVDLPVENNIWFKTAKNWGELKGGANYHGTTFALGYDKAAGKNWRVGGFVSYGNSSFAAGSASSKVQDTRLGVYAGYKRGPHEGYVYLNHGWLKNDLSRGITGIGMAEADYNSRILELGGEYKYDLQANKLATWHVSPYVNMQLSHLWQDGYTESGVGVLGQRVNSAENTYFATGLGLEFKRYLNKGSYAMRLGLRHAFSGANPRVTFGLAGDGATVFEMRGQQDKTHMVMSLGGEAEFS
ncbi:MAG: autotransporter domain-containing protein, partial [Selenomonas sp.]|nr:autotransporter domain-containing protein [Selenomonas sp.]